MSFLSALQSKKNALRPTSTTVTLLSGRKFKETAASSLELPSKGPGFVIDTKPDNVPAKIVDGVYLGSQDCCDENVLTDYNIRRVLSVGIEAPTKYDNIVYKFVQCLDLPETNLIEDVLKDCISFIDSAQGEHSNVLVHCNAGVSRSASVVIGYLILVHHCSYADAYNVVKNARKCIRPNDGFVKQLKQLDI